MAEKKNKDFLNLNTFEIVSIIGLVVSEAQKLYTDDGKLTVKDLITILTDILEKLGYAEYPILGKGEDE